MKEKRIVPYMRGEVWKLADAREVTFLKMLRIIPRIGRLYEVLNEIGMLESIYDRQFIERIKPPVPAAIDGVAPNSERDAGRRGNDGY